MDNKCIVGFGILTAGYLGLAAMFLGYKAKFEKKGIELEKNDQQHKHRIEELEKKNGSEQKQLNELKDKLAKKDQKYKELKGDIRLIKAMMTLSKEAKQKQIKEESEDESEDE